MKIKAVVTDKAGEKREREKRRKNAKKVKDGKT
jgi:hypothetical protein